MRGAGPPSLSRLLFERDSSVDKTIAGGIIGIIYAGFSRRDRREGSSWERGRSGFGGRAGKKGRRITGRNVLCGRVVGRRFPASYKPRVISRTGFAGLRLIPLIRPRR